MRISAQLIKTADNSHLWADSFDRKVTDILSVESEIAKTIADQLQAKLTRREKQIYRGETDRESPKLMRLTCAVSRTRGDPDSLTKTFRRQETTLSRR